MADYANNKEQWPDGLWEEWGDPPPDEKRCQLHVGGPADTLCGLPAHAGTESRERCCLFHCESEDQNPAELRSALEAAVAKGAHLPGANLQGARLWHTDLHGARLIGANLQGASLLGANLQGAYLLFANLQETDLSRTKLQSADLRMARLIGSVDLRGANLTDARLFGFELSPEAKLDNVDWGLGPGNKMLCDERNARSGKSGRASEFTLYEAVYRQIKLSYQYSGDYRRAGQFFIREMECQRAQLYIERLPLRFSWNPFVVWAWLSRGATRALWCVSYGICQHGENPARLAGVMGLVIVLFAFIHSLVGVDGTDGKPIIAPGWAMPLWADLPGQMTKAVYFSVATFTSLGYGDMQPVEGWGQWVAMVEVSLGIILVALLVGCVIRKLSR